MFKFFLICLLPLLLLCGCEKHFITDAEYRRTVEQDFKNKQQLLSEAPVNLFAVFDTPMTQEEREALEFIYAYSPMIDITMNDGNFLLENVRHSLKLRDKMPWGKEIPETVFRHFVLPLRGSNEALDSARFVFYGELRNRVLKCKNMEEAALEVNHWCHEKAIYMPTNARTCSPVTMTTTAYGRCGEESVFALVALRSVGIPARQVYTPRWAHCDDNHAWIEVWVDGKWKYLGACEPEPKLDIAWFTAPVRRGLLMQARVFGKYKSDEEVVSVSPDMTNVNVTANYTETTPVKIQVVDTAGQPVEGAKVEYKIFNYGEYYPAVTLLTDKAGESSLTVGRGDWLVWVSKGRRYGFAELDVLHQGSETLQITLDKADGTVYQLDYDIVPPVEKEYEALVADDERAANDRRFMYEDSVRNAYIASFPNEETARQMALKFGVNEGEFAKYIKASRGNYPQLIQFLELAKGKDPLPYMKVLDMLADKDLQDMKADLLFEYADGLNWETVSVRYPDGGEEIYRNLFNPRVENEPINFSRKELAVFLAHRKISAGNNISVLQSVNDLLRVMQQIKVIDSINTVNISTPPAGVVRAMVADTRSKNLFFVTACRMMTIAARLNPLNSKPEYHNGMQWVPVVFTEEAIAPKGKLMIRNESMVQKDPLYFVNFTIAKIENGTARTIDLGSNAQVDMGAGASFSTIFRQPVEIEEGNYILVTGNRRSDGSVLSNVTAFTVKAGETTQVGLNVRDAAEEVNVLGKIDTGVRFIPEGSETPRTLLLPDKGYTAIALIAANKEPTNHLVRDMSGMKEDFERQGIPMMFLFTDEEQYGKFSRQDFRPLPSVMLLGYDYNREVTDMLTRTLELKNAENLPLILVVNKQGEVVFLSQGYRIGLGTQIMKHLTLK